MIPFKVVGNGTFHTLRIKIKYEHIFYRDLVFFAVLESKVSFILPTYKFSLFFEQFT
jgi:hypothetical protein